MKRYLVLGLVVAGCLLAAMGGRLYYTHRYLPIQAVQPIIKLLDEGSGNSIEEGTYRVRGLMADIGSRKQEGMAAARRRWIRLGFQT